MLFKKRDVFFEKALEKRFGKKSGKSIINSKFLKRITKGLSPNYTGFGEFKADKNLTYVIFGFLKKKR